MNEPKICRNCKWHQAGISPLFADFCNHPRADQRVLDVVSGQRIGHNATACRDMRGIGSSSQLFGLEKPSTFDACGKFGALFEEAAQ